MVPIELQAPPPRDIRAADKFLAKNRSKARACFIGGVALLPAVLALMWLRFGEIDGLSIGLALGVSTLVELFGVAFVVMTQRSLKLYRDGIATVGKVRRVEAPGDGRGNAFVIVHVEFQDGSGQMRLGQLTTASKSTEVDCREGSEIPVLYEQGDARKFAVYTAGLGMVPGVVRG